MGRVAEKISLLTTALDRPPAPAFDSGAGTPGVSLQKHVLVGLVLLLVGGQHVAAQPSGHAASSRWFPRILSEGKPFLPDFSYAGYRWGEKPLPEAPGDVIDVTRFGAVPDDGRDDTDAVQEALSTAHETAGPVVVQFPPGRLIVEEILFVERDRLVLRGAGSGPDGTVLYFPRPLEEMRVPPAYRQPTRHGSSAFGYKGGVVWTRTPGPPPDEVLGRPAAGRRGAHTLEVEGLAGRVQVGDVVRVSWYNRGGNNSPLLRHIYGTADVAFGQILRDPNRALVMQEVTVTGIEGQALSIKEPLLHDVRPQWHATLTPVDLLREVGIEHLQIIFPDDVSYAGHHDEDGYNGIYLQDTAHSWVRDVKVIDADSGILVHNTKNATLTEVKVLGRPGHYTIALLKTYGVLVEDFLLRAPAVHNPSFGTQSAYNVYSGGRLYYPRLDQHKGINHQNLFDDLAILRFEAEGAFFESGGSGEWSPHAGAFNTFWNVRLTSQSDRGVYLGDVIGAPHARLVGVRGDVNFDYGPQPYVEGTNRPGLAVPSLYEYQLGTRTCEGQPFLRIARPAAEDAFPPGTTVPVEVSVFSGERTIEKVEFLVNGTRVGEDREGSDGWQFTWTNVPPGSKEIEARAVAGRDGVALPLTCSSDRTSVWVGEEAGVRLVKNYPNPFHGRTTLSYDLREERHVRLGIYNVLGQRVAELVNERQEAGHKELRFDGGRLASGVYFYRLVVGDRVRTGKMVLVK